MHGAQQTLFYTQNAQGPQAISGATKRTLCMAAIVPFRHDHDSQGEASV